MDLLQIFQALSRPSVDADSGTFSVALVDTSLPHRIGKDTDGAPVFLVSVSDPGRTQPGPLVLLHVAVSHGVRCRLRSAGGVEEQTLTMVRCVSREPALREYFVRIVAMAAKELGSSPPPRRVYTAIRQLIELFRAFELPARRTAQGLWGELVVVALARTPRRVVAAWHADPNEGFDFSDGPRRVEVKSVSGDARVHAFSLRQARPPEGSTVLIASMRVERAAGGASIADVLRQLEGRLDGESFRKVVDVVAASLGDSAPVALGLGFDLERARSSLRYFPAHRVPAIEPPLPPGVLSVRFESLLDESAAISDAELAQSGDFFGAFFPVP